MSAQQSSPSIVQDAVVVIIDCNCFIQVRDLKDIPWRELFPSVRRVEIVVTPSVQRELDEKKVSPKTRIRDRARAALRLVDAASEADPMETVLRAEAPTVILSLPEIAPTDWTTHPRLDSNRPDDRLVAEAIDLVTNLPKWLLSHDSGPRVSARRAKLPVARLSEDWLLPDPVDDDRKQIQKLQRENELLNARYPKIRAGWGTREAPIERLTIERLILPPLSQDIVNAAVARCREKWPPATAVMKVGPNGGYFIGADDDWGVHTDVDYHRYVKKWHDWANGLPAFFEDLPKRIAGGTRFNCAPNWIENAGAATAERLTIDFMVSDGWQVLADQNAVNEIAPLPIMLPERPPTPPQETHKKKAALADQVTRQHGYLLGAEKPHNVTAFYWTERPGHDSTRGVFECAEFRAKRFKDDAIWLWPRGKPPVEGALRIDIHGSNLGEPLILELPLMFVDRDATWSDAAVAACLGPSLAKLLAEVTA
jgi:hypothetical protein